MRKFDYLFVLVPIVLLSAHGSVGLIVNRIDLMIYCLHFCMYSQKR